MTDKVRVTGPDRETEGVRYTFESRTPKTDGPRVTIKVGGVEDSTLRSLLGTGPTGPIVTERGSPLKSSWVPSIFREGKLHLVNLTNYKGRSWGMVVVVGYR